MWQAIEIREIRVFLALAEELHFGRAAARLGLTQSRVSQSVQALERKLGVQLAHRTSRRVTLTTAGERFREQAGGALSGLEDVLRTTAETGRKILEPVRVGVVTATAGGPRLLSLIRRFEASHPGSSVQLVGLPFRDRFGPLRRGEVELMVARLPLEQPDLVTGPVLTREPHLLAVARDHPLARCEDVSVEVLADHVVGELDLELPAELSREFEPRTTPSGRPIPRLALCIQELSELMVAVAQGRIIQPVSTTFAESYRHPGVAFVPIRDMPPSRTALAWRRRDRHPGLREFLRAAQAQVHQTATRPAAGDEPRGRGPG
jgi:DNA-binding transcriptional LysR family regulator